MTAELTRGTRIYRPASPRGPGEDRGLAPEPPAMERFDDGTVMLRAVPDPELAPHWRVVPWETEGGRVCVCDETIPENWIYFEVLFADVNFIAVSPVAGDGEALPGRDLK